MSVSQKSKNNVFLAVAGAGKTTKIVTEVLNQKSAKRVAIITYTNKAVASIIEKFHEKNCGVIPSRVDVFTWYGFLYNECVLPYQRSMFSVAKMKGLTFENHYGKVYTFPKTDIKRYVTKNGQLKAKQASEFVVECTTKDQSLVKRISEIYEEVVIDEVQDLAGADLDLIESFMNDQNIRVILIGDSRQATFSTHSSIRNKKFKGLNMLNYFQELKKSGLIELIELNDCKRSNQEYVILLIKCSLNFLQQ